MRDIFLLAFASAKHLVALLSRYERVLVPAELLHESRSILSRVQIGVGCILAEVLFLVTSFLARTIGQDVYLQLLSMHQFEAVHALSCNPGFLVRGKLDYGVAAIFASVGIFGQLDCVNGAKRTEKFSDVLLS